MFPTKRAFTLLEVLLVIALVGLTLSFVAMNFEGMRDSVTKASPDKQFLKAMKIARMESHQRGKTLELRFNEENSTIYCFEFVSGIKIFEKKIGDEENKVSIQFIPQYPESVNAAGFNFSGYETLPYMKFASDGSATPVTIIVKSGKFERAFNPDPFSGVLRELTKEDEK